MHSKHLKILKKKADLSPLSFDGSSDYKKLPSESNLAESPSGSYL
jgi:hypothetical protein